MLRALADASLIDRTPGTRYGMHDLVRAYATTTADNLRDEVRETSLRRVLDFYTLYRSKSHRCRSSSWWGCKNNGVTVLSGG